MESTREGVRRLVKDRPELNLAGIAAELGVSRERVRQIVASEGLQPAKGVVGYHPRKKARPPEARVVTGGVETRISHTVAGTIGELLVAADLLARGFQVFAPITRHTGACDLVSLRDGATERIEVRCGVRRNGRVVYNKPDIARSDRRAIVITGEPVVYEPPL